MRKQAKQASPRRVGYAGLYVDKDGGTGDPSPTMQYASSTAKAVPLLLREKAI